MVDLYSVSDDGSTGDFSSSDYDRYRYRFSDRLDANGKENPVRPIYLRNIAVGQVFSLAPISAKFGC